MSAWSESDDVTDGIDRDYADGTEHDHDDDPPEVDPPAEPGIPVWSEDLYVNRCALCPPVTIGGPETLEIVAVDGVRAGYVEFELRAPRTEALRRLIGKAVRVTIEEVR